jgi:hypothetical protein
VLLASATHGISYLLALPEDFRTANWTEIIKYPKLVYKKSEEFMDYAFA